MITQPSFPVFAIAAMTVLLLASCETASHVGPNEHTPDLILVTPADASRDVDPGASVTLTFPTSMDPAFVEEHFRLLPMAEFRSPGEEQDSDNCPDTHGTGDHDDSGMRHNHEHDNDMHHGSGIAHHGNDGLFGASGKDESVPPGMGGRFVWNEAFTRCTFTPDRELSPGTTYTVFVGRAVMDILMRDHPATGMSHGGMHDMSHDSMPMHVTMTTFTTRSPASGGDHSTHH